MAEKHTYVVLEPADGSPNVRGFDLYVVPWSQFLETIEDWLNKSDDCRPATMTFTTHYWTEDEYVQWCEEHEIEMGI